MRADNGGPAFPASSWTKDGDFLGENQGMTLRDYFAAKAMQGLIASHVIEDLSAAEFSAEKIAQTIAVSAGEISDAMLKERAK